MSNRFRFVALAAALGFGLIGATIARAQTTQPTPAEGALAVVGEATIRGRPDMAMLMLGVVSDGRTAGEALAGNTADMTRILDALKREGLESRDLQTANFSVEPLYSQPPPDFPHTEPFEPKIVGYRIRNEVAVRIRDLSRVGALLDRSVTLGANSVSGPVFTVADPSALQDQARRAAVRNALDKGKLYAEAAGVPLGPINRIEERSLQIPQPVPMGAMARQEAADSAAVPIEGGELAFRAEVFVSWRLVN